MKDYSVSYLFESRRTECPYCGSSDGFAMIIDKGTHQPYATDIGKCHSCGVFRSPERAGYYDKDTQKVIVDAPPAPPIYVPEPEIVESLIGGGDILTMFVSSLFGPDSRGMMAACGVFGDTYGQTAFLWRNDHGKVGMVKTIPYNDNGKRSKKGVTISGKTSDVSQVAGFISANGYYRKTLVRNGYYPTLFGIHDIQDDLPLVVVESEKTAAMLKVWMDIRLGTRLFNVVAVGGAKGLTKRKAAFLRNVQAITQTGIGKLTGKKALICLDNDVAGETGAEGIAEGLAEWGIEETVNIGMKRLLDLVPKGRFPEDLWQGADLADVVIWAYTQGGLDDDIYPYVRAVESVLNGTLDPDYESTREKVFTVTNKDREGNGPQPVLTMADQVSPDKVAVLAIPGTVVGLIAHAGVGKSSVVSALVAKHLNPKSSSFGLSVKAPEGMLLIDTEQAKDQIASLQRRTLRRAGFDTTVDIDKVFDDMNVSWLGIQKRMPPEEIRRMVFSMARWHRPSMVVVDQVGSLMRNVNDIHEASDLMRDIMDDAESSGRCWVVLLHTNPSSDKARGVIGSELHRWASGMLFIKRPTEHGKPYYLTTSNVDGMMAKVREGPATRCAYSWDDVQGDFYEFDDPVAQVPDIDEMQIVLKEVYSSDTVLSKREISQRMQYRYGKDAKRYYQALDVHKLLRRDMITRMWSIDHERFSNPSGSPSLY